MTQADKAVNRYAVVRTCTAARLLGFRVLVTIMLHLPHCVAFALIATFGGLADFPKSAGPNDPPADGSGRPTPGWIPGLGRANGYVQIPLQYARRSNALWVSGLIGDRAVKLIVDTGATNTSLDERAAERLGLKLETGSAVTTATGERLPTRYSRVRVFSLGPVTRSGLKVEVADFSSLFRHHKDKDGIEFDGLIGANLLDAYSAVIDYKSKCLYLNDPYTADLSLLSGDWIGTDCVYEGAVVRDRSFCRGYRVRVRGDAFVLEMLQQGRGVYTGRLDLNASNPPKRFLLTDVVVNGRKQQGTLFGLYEVGEREMKLLISTGGTPPTLTTLPKKLASTADNGMTLVTFGRAEVARSGGGVSVPWLTVAGLAGLAFPPDGYTIRGWTYTPRADGSVTVTNAPGTITMTVGRDGSWTLRTPAVLLKGSSPPPAPGGSR